MYTFYKNAKIYYTSRGTGNPLVLLHGFLESSEIWDGFAKELSKSRQVICVDLPGHGKSGSFCKVHEMAEMAAAVHVVLQDLKLTEVSLAGHSMGGYVCLELVKKFSILIPNLVLINSTAQEDSAEKKENRKRTLALVRKNKEAFISMAISNLMRPANFKKFQPEIAELKERAFKISEKAIIAAQLGMKNRADSKNAFLNFSNKKFIIAGKQDPILAYEKLKETAQFCKSNLITFPGGHLSLIENKDELLHFLLGLDTY